MYSEMTNDLKILRKLFHKYNIQQEESPSER